MKSEHPLFSPDSQTIPLDARVGERAVRIGARVDTTIDARLPPVAAAFVERRKGLMIAETFAASAVPFAGMPIPAPATSVAARVLHVVPSLDPKNGGVAEAVVQLARHMTPLGCASEVVTLDPEDGPTFDHVDAAVHRVGPGKGFYGFSPRLAQWIRTNRTRFDAIVVHGIWQFHSVAAWYGVVGTQTPLFVFPHGMLDPWFQRTYPAKHLKKRVYWSVLEARVFNRARQVLFTCETELELARRPFLQPHHRLTVNGFGIDSMPAEIDANEAVDAFRAAFPQVTGKRTLLFLSRIHEKKGCDLLIDAFADVAARDPSVILVIAGPGEPAYVETLKRQASARGLQDRIVWTGMLTGKLKWGALAAAEVFVLPSHQENFGIAVVEALAARTPVIITTRVNIWKEIAASGAGWVCSDTREGIGEMLTHWVFETTADEREAMRSAASEGFARHFRIESAARTLLNHVQSARRA